MADLSFGQQIGLNAFSQGAGLVKGAIQGAIQNKYNKNLADYQFDKNLEMWNIQNEYNSPTAQRERFEQAGLNPALMYGGGSVSAGNANSAPQYQQNPIDLIGAFQNSMMNDMQLRQMAKNIEKTDAEKDLIQSQAEGQNIQNQYGPALAQANIDKLISGRKLDEAHVTKSYEEVKQIGVNIREAESRIKINDETIAKLRVETDNEKKRGELMDLEKATTALQQVLIKEQTKTESSKRYSMEAGAYRDLSQASLMDYQAEAIFAKLPLELAQLSAGTGKLEAETGNISVDTVMKEFRNNYYKQYGVFPDATQQQFVLQTLLSGNEDVQEIGGIYRRNIGADTYQKIGIGNSANAVAIGHALDIIGKGKKPSKIGFDTDINSKKNANKSGDGDLQNS